MAKTANKTRVRRPTTTHRLTWRDVTVRVRHTRDDIHAGWDHIELIVVAPKDAILPITETGYLSHFLDADELKAAGGPVGYFLAWIEREAKTKRWHQAEFRWRQLCLFPT